jgi:hypothetical protein
MRCRALDATPVQHDGRSKWLPEILQTTGPKASALAAAGGIIFFGHGEGFAGFADLPSWVVSAHSWR